MKNLANPLYKEEAQRAAQVMQEGGIVLYPTDTIWGIGCDATNEEAVQRIYELKRRHDSKTMIVLCHSELQIERMMDEVPEMAWTLIELSDKPLTIIYPHAKGVAQSLIAADGSLAIRLSKEPFSALLCQYMRRPIVSTSANLSGMPAARCFAEIDPQIIEGVDYVVNCRREERNGKASSIIKLGLGGEVEVIRE